MESINDFISKLENKASDKKGSLIKEKEVPPDIDEHPIDQLDILISECNPENCEKTIKSIKKIIEEHPELNEEFLGQIENQKIFANNGKEEAKKIKDEGTRLKEVIKFEDKLRALTSLDRAINKGGENQDE